MLQENPSDSYQGQCCWVLAVVVVCVLEALVHTSHLVALEYYQQMACDGDELLHAEGTPLEDAYNWAPPFQFLEQCPRNEVEGAAWSNNFHLGSLDMSDVGDTLESAVVSVAEAVDSS